MDVYPCKGTGCTRIHVGARDARSGLTFWLISRALENGAREGVEGLTFWLISRAPTTGWGPGRTRIHVRARDARTGLTFWLISRALENGARDARISM